MLDWLGGEPGDVAPSEVVEPSPRKAVEPRVEPTLPLIETLALDAADGWSLEDVPRVTH
jgi:hypothetical protein